MAARSYVQSIPKEDTATDEVKVDHPLPPELLESIFNYIGSLNELLKCRLVCQDWNHMVCDILEKRCLSQWTQFGGRKFGGAEINPASPLIEQRINGVRGAMLRHVSFPPALKAWKKGTPNPFPSKSVIICQFPCLWDMEKPLGHGVIQLDTFFRRFGHFISTLNLVDVYTSDCELDFMLGCLTNLRALSIRKVTVSELRACVQVIKRLVRFGYNKAAPSFVHLEIFWSMSIGVGSWLLGLVEKQLVTLTLSACNPFIKEICKRKFVNLRKLQILTPVSQDLAENWQVGSAPALQHLVIMIDTDDDVDHEDVSQYEYAATFSGKFASSLVTLCVNAQLFEIGYLLNSWEDSDTIFQKLKSLTLRQAEAIDESHDEPDFIKDSNWKHVFVVWHAYSTFADNIAVKFKKFKRKAVVNRFNRNFRYYTFRIH